MGKNRFLYILWFPALLCKNPAVCSFLQRYSPLKIQNNTKISENLWITSKELPVWPLCTLSIEEGIIRMGCQR